VASHRVIQQQPQRSAASAASLLALDSGPIQVSVAI
jgi:hypothetical protein